MPSSSLQPHVYLGTFVHSASPTELAFLHQTAVFVDEHGRIAVVERDCDVRRAKEVVVPRLGWEQRDVGFSEVGGGEFFFPGFVDTHTHASQTPNTGLFGRTTLLTWLSRYTFPTEARLSRDLGEARHVYGRCIARSLAHGTTTCAYYATISAASTNLLASLCRERGQRALVGRVCMDCETPSWYRDESVESAVQATRECIAHCRALDADELLLRAVVTPRFAVSCSEEMMRALAKLASEEDVFVQTHVDESRDEVEFVEGKFCGRKPPSQAENAVSIPGSEQTPTEDGSSSSSKTIADNYCGVYDACGLLSSKTILAHAIHVTDAEAALIATRGCGIAHCPVSNETLSSGRARVRRLLDKGITVGLGTDVSGGYSASILEGARRALVVSRHIAFDLAEQGAASEEVEHAKLTVEEVLHLATRGGAKVVGLEGKVGAFEVGMDWDAQLIRLGDATAAQSKDARESSGQSVDQIDAELPVDIYGWETWPERIEKWLFGGDDRNTQTVWVAGKSVHQRRRR